MYLHIYNMTFYPKILFFTKIRKILFLGMSVIFTLHGFGQWTQSQFIIGTFWDPKLTNSTDTNNANAAADIARFVEAKNAGFNLMTGTGENADVVWHTTAGMDYALYVASKAGVKYLVTDMGYWGCPEIDTWVANSLLPHYQNLPEHMRNAMYGYHLKDEPIESDETNVKAWLSFFKGNDNTKLSYINLMPRYYFAAGSSGDALYDAYLESYLNDADPANRPDVAAYDNYPVLSGGTVRTDYFYNLNIVRTKAGTRPFWCYPMTTSLAGYADPTATYIMFSDFCPLAYGAKGLIYFTYTLPANGGPFYNAIVDASGNQTPNYNIVKTINQYINNLVGTMIMNSTSIGAYHKSTQPTGEAISSSQMLSGCPQFLSSSNGLGNNNLLAGIFQDKTDFSIYHGLIVNKSFTTVSASTIVLEGDYSSSIYLAPSVVGYDGSTMFTEVASTYSAGTTSFTMPALEGGEGRLFTTSVPIISGTSVSNATSTGGADGSITINAAGGTGSIQYSINDGITWQASNVFTGLIAGNYIVRAKDANNFEFSYTSNPVTIETEIVTSETEISSSSVEIALQSCNLTNENEAVLVFTGNENENYLFSLFDNAGQLIFQKPVRSNSAKTIEITISSCNLSQGIYLINLISKTKCFSQKILLK
jgi:hypothetical protein